MLFSAPIWHSFPNIPSDSEAAFAASSSMFSLMTLAITSNSGYCGFALTEQKQHDLWRWALISADGHVDNEGWEPTESSAKKSAVGAMRHIIAEESHPVAQLMGSILPIKPNFQG